MEKDSGWIMEVEFLGKFSHSALDIFTGFSFEEAVGSQLSGIAADQKRKTKKTGNDQNEATQVSGEAFAQAFHVAIEYIIGRSLLQELYYLKDSCTIRAVGMGLGRTQNEMMDLLGYIERVLSLHIRASRCHREGNSF